MGLFFVQYSEGLPIHASVKRHTLISSDSRTARIGSSVPTSLVALRGGNNIIALSNINNIIFSSPSSLFNSVLGALALFAIIGKAATSNRAKITDEVENAKPAAVSKLQLNFLCKCCNWIM